jgi:glycine hydroxymethyltransferase
VEQVANWIADVLDSEGSADTVARVAGEVTALCRRFPVYEAAGASAFPATVAAAG